MSALSAFDFDLQSQLEFLTLTGVIFNGLMQGYICANSIYVYMFENLENEPIDLSNSAFAQSVIYDESNDSESGGSRRSGGASLFNRSPSL